VLLRIHKLVEVGPIYVLVLAKLSSASAILGDQQVAQVHDVLGRAIYLLKV